MKLPFKILVFLSLITVSFFLTSSVFAFPEYAEQTGKDRSVCHVDPTGGQLTKAGEDFCEELKAQGEYRPLHPLQKVVRLIVGYLHLLTAIV